MNIINKEEKKAVTDFRNLKEGDIFYISGKNQKILGMVANFSSDYNAVCLTTGKPIHCYCLEQVIPLKVDLYYSVDTDYKKE